MVTRPASPEVVTRSSLQRAATIGFAGLAVALLLLLFLPWAAWLGFATSGEASAYFATLWLWARWTTGLVLLAAVVTVGWGKRVDDVIERWRIGIDQLSGDRYALCIAAIVAIAAALLSKLLFAHNPHLVDTVAQLFQGRIFTHGSVTAPAPADYEFFAATHLVRHGGQWFSQYPPGHPAILALGLLAGVPWLVNPLFAAATVLLIYGAAHRLLGKGSAKLAATLYLLSPFALFMSASYMNHVTSTFFLALALYGTVRAVAAEGPHRWAVLAGVALGLAATIRPLEAAAWASVLGLWMLYRRGWEQALLAGGACLLGLTPLLVYNALTAGEPLLFGYTLLWGSAESLGFHTDPWGEPFNLLRAFSNTALDFQRLNAFLFGWPFPSLIFALAALGLAAVDRGRRHTWALLVGLLLAAPLAYFFYWHRDDYLGPRFLYSVLIPVILLSAAGIAGLDKRLGTWRPVLRLAVLTGLTYSLVVYLPAGAGVVAGRMPEMKLHPEVQAERSGIRDGLVFVKVGWGSRLIARLWAWGVSASETERSYRAVDGCRLQSALDAADVQASAGGDSLIARRALQRQLREWRESELPLVKDVLPDPSVRVDTTRPLEDPCLREVGRDSTGFTVYGSLVWRNDPWLQRGIVYARDLGPERNRRLMAAYPDRDYYLYAPVSTEPGAWPKLWRLEGAAGPEPGAAGLTEDVE